MEEQPDGLAQLLDSLRSEFLQTVIERLDIIRTEAEGLPIATEPRPGLTRLIREAHTLKGGGATFGFPSLTDAGGAVEREGKALLAAGGPLGSVDSLHAAIAELERVVNTVRAQ